MNTKKKIAVELEVELARSKIELTAALIEIEKFKANNRYQRGYHDGQIEARAKQSDCIKEMREALERLGSASAFHGSALGERYNKDALARMEYARAVLAKWPD